VNEVDQLRRGPAGDAGEQLSHAFNFTRFLGEMGDKPVLCRANRWWFWYFTENH
jgi:hypothetical protein